MKKRFRSVRLRDLSAFSKSCLRYCISYGLLRASHFRTPTSMSTPVPLSRHFALILVAFEIAKVSYARFACAEPFCVFEERFCKL